MLFRSIPFTTTPGTIDYNSDNAQNLAIYVAVSFPNIPPAEANYFVDQVMAERHRSDMGFDDARVD